MFIAHGVESCDRFRGYIKDRHGPKEHVLHVMQQQLLIWPSRNCISFLGQPDVHTCVCISAHIHLYIRMCRPKEQPEVSTHVYTQMWMDTNMPTYMVNGMAGITEGPARTPEEQNVCTQHDCAFQCHSFFHLRPHVHGKVKSAHTVHLVRVQ
jgi:hypothetical protein